MGDVYATLGIWAANGSHLENTELLVDTGSSFSQLPRKVLRELGWTPTIAPQRTPLADGSATMLDLGEVKIRYDGKALMRRFVFGEDDCLPLLGSDTLPGFGLGVDPVHHRLINVVAHR